MFAGVAHAIGRRAGPACLLEMHQLMGGINTRFGPDLVDHGLGQTIDQPGFPHIAVEECRRDLIDVLLDQQADLFCVTGNRPVGVNARHIVRGGFGGRNEGRHGWTAPVGGMCDTLSLS